MSEGPPGSRSESTERPRIRQAVSLHGAATSERTTSGPVFVSQPAAAEPAPSRPAGRARRRSRSTAQAGQALRTATPAAPASATAAGRADDGGSAPTGTAAAAPTAAPPRAAADSSTPPTRQASGGSGGPSGRPLMAAAAIAGAVLVSVPLVVSQRSNAEQSTRAVGDVTAPAPVATLGERGGATWPSTQGGTGKKAPEPADRLQQPPGVLPQPSGTLPQPSGVQPPKTAPGLPDRVDDSGYRPPLITPANKKKIEKPKAVDRKADDGRTDSPLGTVLPVRSSGGHSPDTTARGSGKTPRTVLAASDTKADRPSRPSVKRTDRSGSSSSSSSKTKTATRAAAPRPVKAPAPRPAKVAEKKTRTAPAAPTVKQGQTKVLHGTYVIGRGQSVSTNRISLTMQQNGNLVIFDTNGRARWSSGTSGRGDRAVFQGDGNLVVLAADGTTVWSTRTDGNPGAQLVLQNDGNVTIQSAGGRFLWGSGTQY
ncbi:hypothetical protein ACFRAO_08780 [Streptomyces sp. NPDC056656]|uniref:hypothetical protein n=1 Tax=Streptomyces sp. NPDC056656 TaxID=3345895 RepID=UPI0036C8495B